MLISGVSEGEGCGKGRDTEEYQTADELFELMAKEQSFDTNDNQSLSTRDLIILYKNIDVGTKLMSNANVGQRKVPNQHVETIVYKDEREADESDVSEVYSNEDLQDVFSINNERIDLINNLSSIQHPLCHKFGDIEFQPSNFTSEYDSHFLFKDPYIKQQLKDINILPDSTEIDAILPASLLDYICCKRLDDNYNFYMDSIIKYVQHTIEQLKRISNGDYLTDRAKEKWKEVAKELIIPKDDVTKVLATSVSIPIHVMGKVIGHRSIWDDIVHSEVDVRSLSKILEKKIIIEVPKLICGSYKLFGERCTDNLIISCKKDINLDLEQENGESRVDVVFQLSPSESGNALSNINSIMILQKIPSITSPEPNGLQLEEIEFGAFDENLEEQPKIVELHDYDDTELESVAMTCDNECRALDIVIKKSISDINDCSSLSNNYCSLSQSSIVDRGQLDRKVSMKTLKVETDVTAVSSDELHSAIRRLNLQTPVPEESEESSIRKKKSPTRVRIKSPYENQSHAIEEKKRMKLLEIREKREKKKLALNENCKVTKHKYGKSAVMAQSSNSVTKLSITNKSFYNSIYGESANQEGGISNKARKLQKKDLSDQSPSNEENDNEFLQSSLTALDRSSLDDGTTETIMELQQKLDKDTNPTSFSGMTDYSTDVNLLSQLIGSSCTDCSSDGDSSPVLEIKENESNTQDVNEGNNNMADVDKCKKSFLAPANTPKDRDPSDKHQDESKKSATPVECRKSIDKIYDLLKNLGKHDNNEITDSVSQYVPNNTEDLNLDGGRSSTIQVSDSGTSVKHHIISSNPSTFSFEKNNNLSRQTYKDKKKKEAPATVVPKVIISSKLQTSKVDAEWTKTDRKRITNSPSHKVTENPLKAISQLLHEFDNVQKTRHKTHKKDDHMVAEGKTVTRQGSSKKTKQDLSSKEAGLIPSKPLPYKERRSRLGQPIDPAQFSHQLTYGNDKHSNRLAKRNLSDIIDEAKEARGEAVRGPKPYSRLNTLAQPKKSYVQAHSDEYQNKYGRNIIANRFHRVTTSAPLVEKNIINVNNARNKRKGPETTSTPSPPKPGIPAVPPLDRIIRTRRSASNSPVRKRVPQPASELSFRQLTSPKIPDLKKKMVAVESYVKSHYGHIPIDTSELKGHEVHKSRVPLIPNDIELASISSPIAEESTALGNQLHYMVDTMINTKVPVLSVLTECQESTSKLSDGVEKLSTDSSSKIDERKSDSDYPVDIFKDKSILTAVASIPKDKIQDKVVDKNIDTIDTYDVQPFNSATELRKLENALYQQMSVGAFPKRLRIKNLTLTPKQSLQQVIVVHSGDAGSLLVKSSLSQSLRGDSKTDSLTALKPLTALSNTHVNWGFTNIPLQVATIGYAFPTFQSTQKHTLTPGVQALMEKPSSENVKNVSKDAFKSHKTSQCFKGVHTEFCLDRAIQANIASGNSTSNVNMVSIERKQKIKPEIAKSCEKMQPITKVCERIRSIAKKYDKEQLSTTECQRLLPIQEKCEKLQSVIEKCDVVKQITEQGDKSKDVIMSSKMSLSIDESDPMRKSSEIIDHSTSLDILMGLLNEIRNITGETTNKKNIDNEPDANGQCKEFQIILNNAATHESSVNNNCRDLVSVSSLDRFDSNPSICSFSILKDTNPRATNENKDLAMVAYSRDSIKPKNVDKEVTAEIEKQYVNKLTDVPSFFFPLKINHSTNMSDSVIEILSEPSTRSVYSFAKYETHNCNPYLHIALGPSKSNNTIVLSTANNATEHTKHSPRFSALDDTEDQDIHRHQAANVQVEATDSYKCASSTITSTTCVAIGSNFDPLMKVKRDILVTLYSILVFTVFAALSFPKVFFHVEM